MPLSTYLRIALALALAFTVSPVLAAHTVTVINRCPFVLTPMYKSNSDGASHTTASKLAPGRRLSISLPDVWVAGRMFFQSGPGAGDCAIPDGGACTLIECTFGPRRAGQAQYDQCNISVVSGYNVPVAYKYIGGDEPSCERSMACLSPRCPASQAYLPGPDPEACEGCITQCNTLHVGLEITLCPPGATIPIKYGGINVPPPPKPRPPAAAPSPPPSPAAVSSSDTATATTSRPPTALNVAPRPTGKRCPPMRKRAHHARQRMRRTT